MKKADFFLVLSIYREVYEKCILFYTLLTAIVKFLHIILSPKVNAQSLIVF